MTMGKRLRLLRVSRDLTQEELGRRIGRTQQTIYRWETGRLRLQAEWIPLLADVLQVPCSAFFEQFSRYIAEEHHAVDDRS